MMTESESESESEPGPRRRGGASEALSEDALLDAVRAGDTGAYAELYHRHHHEALRLARSLPGHHDPDDVAQEAFLKILKSILRGAGPRRGFAPYLMRVVRHEAVDRGRRAHEDAVEDLERAAPGRLVSSDGMDELLNRQLVRTAFARLPETWQRILWLTEVEGETPRALAPQLGRSPNAISQLSRRAREGLRAAWLEAHLDTAHASPLCRSTARDLDDLERGRLTRARAAGVERHLAACPRCAAAREELRGLTVQMRSVLLPVVLASPLLLEHLTSDVAAVGPAADGAPAPRTALRALEQGGVVGGGLGTLRSAVSAHAGALVTAGAIAAAVVGGMVLLDPTSVSGPVLGTAATWTDEDEPEDGEGAAAGRAQDDAATTASPSSQGGTGAAGATPATADGTTAPVQVPAVGEDQAGATTTAAGTAGEDPALPDSPTGLAPIGAGQESRAPSATQAQGGGATEEAAAPGSPTAPGGAAESGATGGTTPDGTPTGTPATNGPLTGGPSDGDPSGDESPADGSPSGGGTTDDPAKDPETRPTSPDRPAQVPLPGLPRPTLPPGDTDPEIVVGEGAAGGPGGGTSTEGTPVQDGSGGSSGQIIIRPMPPQSGSRPGPARPPASSGPRAPIPIPSPPPSGGGESSGGEASDGGGEARTEG
ncbi:sigma-70 family RNA polymerase sigma factor [Brachybacterium paraconglomeratum]|uniref:sigma-70 family RNA polymerase sigma factor n=1 Tax=Brachybacterium paraconglomeratum TaxID=173362 RepID=UPI0021A423AB|nr:sigma-70 family RNA polymerase sigma factor [Brachybacterium paraconglomeratum]MCT1910013.1 sigma-70 family RNA polymerase sigma factor [Brachybacterium paraconglomeratum]